ncbi:MAG: cytochrome b/b6 domain-containing protein [Nitrospinota bacterium]
MKTKRILRFRCSERLLHWSIALPFLACLVTALTLVFLRDMEFMAMERELMSRAHKISGLFLITLPVLVLLVHIRDFIIHIKNIKEGWLWSFDDIKWLALMPFSMISSLVSLPEEGKFNAGEKVNFIMTMLGHSIFGITGFLMLTTEDSFLANIVHILLAILVLPVVGGHIFMATINPPTRKGLMGMVTGFVDREWAKHHYRRWYVEKFGEPDFSSGGVHTKDKDQTGEPSGVWIEALFRPIPAVVVIGSIYLITFFCLEKLV